METGTRVKTAKPGLKSATGHPPLSPANKSSLLQKWGVLDFSPSTAFCQLLRGRSGELGEAQGWRWSTRWAARSSQSSPSTPCPSKKVFQTKIDQSRQLVNLQLPEEHIFGKCICQLDCTDATHISFPGLYKIKLQAQKLFQEYFGNYWGSPPTCIALPSWSRRNMTTVTHFWQSQRSWPSTSPPL